ncbi:AAA family ATPase [Candidatus Aerophobetes bacterium]|nr:AAA family ATPase [Candidatus Aerophobetes bacterium]
MNRSEVKDFIRNKFKSQGFKIIEVFDHSAFDMVFRHSDLGYNVFFKFYKSSKELEQNWFEVQEKVKEIIEKRKILSYNSYLIFALPQEYLPSETEIQRIIFDEYVCRKLIFPIDSSLSKLKKDILKFPFYPLDIPEATEHKIPKGVVDALSITKFDQQLVNDIAGRISPPQIIRKILSNEYGEYVTGKIVQLPEESRVLEQHDRKLKEITIENFRGIGSKVLLNLDADIAVIYGPNGTGKTSIFDAIEWTITGQVERLQKPIKDIDLKIRDIIVNLFHKENLAKIKIELYVDGETKNIERSLDPLEKGKSKVTIDNSNVTNKTVIAVVTGNELLKSLIKRVERFRKGFLASHILKQETLTQFISHTNPKMRYDSFSYIVGTQDFVRFRDKVGDIINRMEKEIKQLQVKISDVSEQIGEKRRRFTEKEKEYNQLSKAIVSLSEANLLNEIRELLKITGLPILVDLINRIRHPTKGLAESIVEISSKYVDSMRKELNNFISIIEQGEITIQKEQEIKGIKSLVDVLTKKKEKIDKQKQAIGSEITKKEQGLLNIEKERKKLQIFIDDIDWLIRMKPFYEGSNERLEEVSKEFKKTYAREREITGKINKVVEKEEISVEKLQNNKNQLNKIEKLIKVIESILGSVDEWKDYINRRKIMIRKIDDLYTQMQQTQETKEKMSKELDNLNDKIKKVEAQINLQKKKYNQRMQLIGRLREYIDSSKCPFCGHKWDDIQILLANVDKQINELPESLRILIRKEKEFKASKNEIELKIAQQTSKINELKNQRELLLLKKREIESNIESWEEQVQFLPFSYTIIKIEDKSMPERKSLEQIRDKLKEEIRIVYKTKTKLEENLSNAKKKYNSLNEELAGLKKSSKKLRENFDNLNQTIENMRKEMTNRDLVELVDEKISVLKKNKEEYSTKLLIQTDREKALENELKNLRNGLVQINLKEEDIFKKISMSKSKLQELCALQSDFIKGVRPYVAEAEGKSLAEILKRIQELKTESKRRYQLYSSLKRKADDLKKTITLGVLKKNLQSLRMEISTIGNRNKKSKGELENMRRWRKRLEDLKRETSQKRRLQEQRHFDCFRPTINLIYHRLNAHPLLGDIEISFKREELKIISKTSFISPQNTGKVVEIPPSHVFSEAQLNTLAISIFLASAIEQGWSRFRAILIDDPVQNMDDLNSYAFLDLILGLAGLGHQFIISTCNRDFYKLMLMKFSCLNKTKKRFIAYRLQGIYREGPKIMEDTPRPSMIEKKRSFLI